MAYVWHTHVAFLAHQLQLSSLSQPFLLQVDFWLINFHPHEPSLLLPGLALLMVVSNGHVSAMIEVFSRKLAFKRREVGYVHAERKLCFDSFHPCLRHP